MHSVRPLPSPESKPKRPLGEVLADMGKPLPTHCLAQRKQGGQTLKYLPWYKANRLLDQFTNGHWEGRITQIHTTSDRIFVTYAITIHTSDGSYTREATGTEVLKEAIWDKDSQSQQLRELSYGDCSSNAESQAFRRACARFGLALNLYDKEGR